MYMQLLTKQQNKSETKFFGCGCSNDTTIFS